MDIPLITRLQRAGVDPDAIDDPQAAFLALVDHEGPAVTVADRLALEAGAQGVAVDALPGEARRRAIQGFFRLRWEGFEVVGEERRDPIEVVAYDPAWPDRFAAWRDRLAAALGDTALRICHVGSTAVLGLAAKPVIDILVIVADLDGEESYVPGIEAAGIALRSRDAHHRYFRPAPGRPREVQVHVCTAGSRWERDHLLFRDYLRAHDHTRDEYAALKGRLAEQYPDDRLAYTEAKTEFVTRILAAAEVWQAG